MLDPLTLIAAGDSASHQPVGYHNLVVQGRTDERTYGEPAEEGGRAVKTNANADTARRIIEQIPTGEIDSGLLHPQFRVWTISSGDLSADRYLGLMKRFAGLFAPPVTITVTGVTDGGDRVAIEATSHGTLSDGHSYRNSYHFLLAFDDGLVREIREYLDPGPLTAIRPLLER
jgi:ketosteroid isomerase-like protein